MHTELENDNSYDFDDGGDDEPLIDELDLDSVVNQVPQELLEQLSSNAPLHQSHPQKLPQPYNRKQ